ncbi:MAG TPA: hypothetical protein VF950_17815 [Planctomycetota bacterium]
MSYARLPDGSRIVDRAAPDARVRRDLSFDRIVSELRAAKSDLLMNELRALDGGQGRADHDAVIRRIASAIQNGRLVWELPPAAASSAGGSALPAYVEPAPAQEEKKPASPVTTRGGTTIIRASLFTGGTTFRKAAPPKKPKVTPELALEYAVALLRSPDATRIECSFTQDPEAPKFEKGLRLSFQGVGEVEAYADEKLTTKLDLGRPVPAKVFLKAVKAGLLELALEAEEDERFERAPAKAAMAVVELNLALHKQDVDAIGRIHVNPDTDPVSKYHDDLKALTLPAQIEVADAEKADGSRWLHVQRGGHHARAKLVLRKLDAARWPAGVDDYRITLEAEKVALYDVEWDGAALPLPYSLKVGALKAADKTLWVEGREASAKLGDVHLKLGLDRAPGGLAKTPKREGAVARLTVAEIAELKVDYATPAGEATAWDEANGRFYINLMPDPDGRELTLRASLKPALPGIPVHFMLAPDPNNGKALPKSWIWKDIQDPVKHRDRIGRDGLYGFQAVTDASGTARQSVFLSRFGGDVFHPAAYLDQDPHLTRYVRGHAELAKRAPVFAAKPIQVWRKFWVQRVEVEGFRYPDLGAAARKWDNVYARMEDAGSVVLSRSAVDAWGVPVFYPRYVVELGGGPETALVATDATKRTFFQGLRRETDKPVKVPILICDAVWNPAQNTKPVSKTQVEASNFPVDLYMSEMIVMPPLQGGGLIVSGTWNAKVLDPSTGAYRTLGSGPLTDQDLFVDPNRLYYYDVKLRRPSGSLPFADATHVDILDLALKGARKSLGAYDASSQDIIAGCDPRDLPEFQNTIAHEIGHGFKQACEPGTQPDYAPAHPHPDITHHQPWHCVWQRDKCLMYRTGPIPGTLGEFCPACQPYVLVEDMSGLL